MLEIKLKLFIHCSAWDMGLNDTPGHNKLLKSWQITLHNSHGNKSSFLCIAWAEISSVRINTACFYLQVHLSNTADVTDRLCAAGWQMPAAWWPRWHVHGGKKPPPPKKKPNNYWGLAKTSANKQLNGWTDGQLVVSTFLFVLFLSVCLSLLPFICSGAEKTRASPPPQKALRKTKMQWRKLKSVK